MTDNEILYATSDDKRKAQEIAENLCLHGRRAIVVTVQELHLYRSSLAPRTTNRYAIIASRKLVP